jgi:Flp pilus assembly pilin Flp
MFEQIGLRIAMALNGASLRRDEGQTLVEYALILVTISIGVTAAMLFLRNEIAGVFSDIGSKL